MTVPRITKEELKRRLSEPAVEPRVQLPLVLDVRLKYPYEHSTITIPGAIRTAPGSLDPSSLPRDRDIVLYDSDPEELVAERAAADLIALGYRAFALQGGISAWAAAKFPTESKPAPQLAAPVSNVSKT
jgi:rhodanese-related sulfurtransferase